MTDDSTENLLLDFSCKGVGYGEKSVLLPFHLQITEGQHIAVLGASGAGKSTLLKAVYDHLEIRQQKSALIPQQLGLVENLSVYHNIYIGRLDQYTTFSNLINLIIPKFSATNEIKSILDQLRLSDRLFTPCGELSGGQRQRIAIARAIFRQAPILIADEPVASLDQGHAETALEMMISRHTSSVLALHNISQALRYCNRIIGIANGVIMLDAPSAQLNHQDLSSIYNATNA